MEKRIVLFLILSFGIIFGFDFVMKSLGLLPETPPVAVEEAIDVSSPMEGRDDSVRMAAVMDADRTDPSAGVSDESRAPGRSDTPARIEDVETPLYRARFTTQGAQIQSWQLKQYLTQHEDPPHPVEFVYAEGRFAGPMSVRTADPDVTAALNTGTFDVSRDFDVLDDAHPVGHLTFSYRDDARDLVLEKEFTFTHDSYVVDVSMHVRGLDEDVEVLLGTNFGIVEWGQGFIGALGLAWKSGDVLEKETPEPTLRRDGDIRWVALQDKYFISVIIPRDARALVATTETDYVVTAGVTFPVADGDSRLRFQLYAGPKQFDLMRSLGHGLEDTIDFGWFIYGSWGIVKAVAKPLFYVLRFLHDYTQNYGVAIILLTCGIKLLFVPLQYKSYKSMQGMQTIQPRIKIIQDKWKHDKERLNKELIKAYKEHKVNPVGGCLPMVLQMPVFISLFNILYMTVDLRSAPFALWVTDLSIPDPYYVLPVLMGVSMVVQQKIMPTTMDPTQAKMMLLLPVFLTFLFLTFPAGLVIYWLTNNALTILQQVVTDRFVLKKPPPGSPSVAGASASASTVPALPSPDRDDAGASKKKKGKGQGPPTDGA